MAEASVILEILDHLKKALLSRQISEAGTLKLFLEMSDQPAFLERPALRVAGHFDLQADFLVWSRRLGALGVVHVLDGDAKTHVRRYVDHAAYVRHLILTDRGLDGLQAATVELVLVAPHDSGLLSKIGLSLDRIAAETALLHAIGVNVLPHRGGEEPFTKTDLRRAFCWLLQDVDAWYKCPFAQQPHRGDGEAVRLASIELENYRLPGKHVLELDRTKNLRIHLLHGRNGCGKSTFAEALELAWTRRIERLGHLPPAEYNGVVRYRGLRKASPAKHARITLRYRGRSRRPLVVTSDEIGDPFLGAPRAASFRLDQTVMDRLTRLDEEARSNTFLQAFFPEERTLFEKYEKARVEASQTFDALPDDLRSTFKQEAENERCTALLAHFGWIQATEMPTDEQLEICLPIPREALAALEPLTGWFFDELRTDTASLPEKLGQLDDVIAGLRPKNRSRIETLRLAGAALAEFGDWVPRSDESAADDFPEFLNQWLELSALTDLAERHDEIVVSLEAAVRRGWRLPWDKPVGLFASRPSTSEMATMRSRSREWAAERDRAFQAVMAASARRAQKPVGAGKDETGRAPTNAEIAAFDTLGPLLIVADEGAASSLGKTIDQAVRARHHIAVGDLVIGRQGWRKSLGDKLTSLLQACEELDRLGEISRSKSAAGRYRLVKEALEKHQELANKGVDIKETFLGKIAPSGNSEPSFLNEALNELMALFTPARWAYDDISITHETDDEGRQQVGVHTSLDNVSPMLRFNTAELNLFTVALFLLCAVRVPNPHRLLILDDPLQNMDEMTITTLARGLAKVVRLLDPEWQLLLLFHGEDDLERFRREVPAAVYSLGWLGPADGSTKKQHIRSEARSRLSSEIRDIASLLEEL